MRVVANYLEIRFSRLLKKPAIPFGVHIARDECALLGEQRSDGAPCWFGQRITFAVELIRNELQIAGSPAFARRRVRQVALLSQLCWPMVCTSFILKLSRPRTSKTNTFWALRTHALSRHGRQRSFHKTRNSLLICCFAINNCTCRSVQW